MVRDRNGKGMEGPGRGTGNRNWGSMSTLGTFLGTFRRLDDFPAYRNGSRLGCPGGPLGVDWGALGSLWG